MALNVDSAKSAVMEKVAKPLGIELIQACWGIHQVVDENMASAARIHCIEKGRDPSGFLFIAFGGAGPLHAFWVAKKLGIKRIFYPLGAGATSALGFLAAPLSFDFVRTAISRLEQLDHGHVNRLFNEMEKEGRMLLRQAGVADREIMISRFAEMRYLGQAHEIYVPVPNEPLSGGSAEQLRTAFDRAYEQILHRTNAGYPVEAINWRLHAVGAKPALKLHKVPQQPGQTLDDARKPSRLAFFPEYGELRDCPVLNRYRLFEGAAFQGPAIIEERESTVIIGPGSHVTTDVYLNLLVTMGE